MAYADPTGQFVGTSSLGGGIKAQFGAFGGSVSAGKIVGTDGRTCSYVTVCGRIGFGAFLGVDSGISAGANSGNTNNAGGWTLGGGYDVAAGIGTGGNLNVGASGIGRGIFSRSLGVGISGGADICHTSVFNCNCGQ